MVKTRKELNKAVQLQRYNITEADYDRILAEQNGGCGICGVLPAHKTFHIDHDHTTGHVRGILCHQCNMMLGGAGDLVDTLEKGIQYLLNYWRKLQ